MATTGTFVVGGDQPRYWFYSNRNKFKYYKYFFNLLIMQLKLVFLIQFNNSIRRIKYARIYFNSNISI